MKVSCSFSCVLLLSFGVCFPPDRGREFGSTGENLGGTQGQAGPFQACRVPKGTRCPQDLSSLLPKWPPGLGKEKAAVRSRLRRQHRGGQQDPGHEAVSYLLPEEDGEKRAGALGSLAEELSGYSRKKGGFNFRFGRRKKNGNRS